MAVFMTGATELVGSYAADWLLRNTDHELALLVDAGDYDEAVEHSWRSLQLHMQAEEFHRFLERICFISGNPTLPNLGISSADYDWLISNAESILHTASSPTPASEQACSSHHLRGTLSTVQLARAIDEDHPLRRFTMVSAASVAGYRRGHTILESDPLDWSAPDLDAYGRTKKFAEHMVRELLPDVPSLVVRPSIVLGDSRFPETMDTEAVRALCLLASLPVLPFCPDARVDIVNADWVGPSIGELHLREDLGHETYHLTSGGEARTLGELAEALSQALRTRRPRFVERLLGPTKHGARWLAELPSTTRAQRLGSTLSIALPYLTTDTVYDNARSVRDLGSEPVPFTRYAADLYNCSKSLNFELSHRELPTGLDLSDVPPEPVRPMA